MVWDYIDSPKTHRMPWICLHINAMEQNQISRFSRVRFFFLFLSFFLFIFISSGKKRNFLFVLCWLPLLLSSNIKRINSTESSWQHWNGWPYYCIYESNMLTMFALFLLLQIIMLWAARSFFLIHAWCSLAALTMIFSLFLIFAHYLWILFNIYYVIWYYCLCWERQTPSHTYRYRMTNPSIEEKRI